MKIPDNLTFFKAIIDNDPGAIIIIKRSSQKIVYHNKFSESLLGDDLEDLNTKEILSHTLIHKDHEFHIKISTKNGSTRLGAVIVKTLSWDRKFSDYQVLYIRDISGNSKKESESYIDSLTGVPLRELFLKRVEEAIALASENNGSFGLLYLDLDDFKPVNDTFGHEAGDKVLKIAVKRIKACIRESDTVGRLGGDEFGVILLNLKAPENITFITKKIIDSIEQEIKIAQDKTCYISTSVGMSVYPSDGTNYQKLIRNADRAMYAVKHERSKGKYAYYSDGILDQYKEKKFIETSIKKSIKAPEQFELHFMPQVDLKTFSVIAVEALTYWRPDDGKLRLPFEFLPVLNNSNLIVDVEHIVFSKAGNQVIAWMKNLPNVSLFRLIINLSSKHFTSFESIGIIDSLIENIGINPESLEFEITESTMMNDKKAIEILQELRRKKVCLTIDNYGTHTTSLLSLKRFPINAIKMDRLFVRNILKDKTDRAIVKNTIQMAKEIGLKTIAQGVESEEQLEMLLKWGCDEAQGYLFGKPLPAESFFEYIQNFKLLGSKQ